MCTCEYTRKNSCYRMDLHIDSTQNNNNSKKWKLKRKTEQANEHKYSQKMLKLIKQYRVLLEISFNVFDPNVNSKQSSLLSSSSFSVLVLWICRRCRCRRRSTTMTMMTTTTTTTTNNKYYTRHSRVFVAYYILQFFFCCYCCWWWCVCYTHFLYMYPDADRFSPIYLHSPRSQL